MKKILVVSTDQELFNTLEKQLATTDFLLEILNHQEHLPEKIKSKKPDVLLIDFLLGDANAAAVCHQIKSDPDMPDLPIILLSDFAGMEQLAAKLGSFAILEKPLNTTILIENISSAIMHTDIN